MTLHCTARLFRRAEYFDLRRGVDGANLKYGHIPHPGISMFAG